MILLLGVGFVGVGLFAYDRYISRSDGPSLKPGDTPFVFLSDSGDTYLGGHKMQGLSDAATKLEELKTRWKQGGEAGAFPGGAVICTHGSVKYENLREAVDDLAQVGYDDITLGRLKAKEMEHHPAAKVTAENCQSVTLGSPPVYKKNSNISMIQLAVLVQSHGYVLTDGAVRVDIPKSGGAYDVALLQSRLGVAIKKMPRKTDISVAGPGSMAHAAIFGALQACSRAGFGHMALEQESEVILPRKGQRGTVATQHGVVFSEERDTYYLGEMLELGAVTCSGGSTCGPQTEVDRFQVRTSSSQKWHQRQGRSANVTAVVLPVVQDAYWRATVGKPKTRQAKFGVLFSESPLGPYYLAYLAELGDLICSEEGVNSCPSSKIRGFKVRRRSTGAWFNRPGKPGAQQDITAIVLPITPLGYWRQVLQGEAVTVAKPTAEVKPAPKTVKPAPKTVKPRNRSRRARAPRVVAGRAQVHGALDKEIIRRIIRRHINEVKYCYQKELQVKPGLYGRVVIQFTISGTGQVVMAVVQSSTMNNRNVETCIARAVRRWLFPKPKGGGIVIVSFPFVLRSAAGSTGSSGGRREDQRPNPIKPQRSNDPLHGL